MRVLIASGLGTVVGGRETYLRAVIPLLRAAGHDLGFAFERPAAGEPSLTGTDPGPIWRLPVCLAAVAGWRPDVVYLHGLADPATETALAARHPTAYFPHGYFGTCISGSKCHSRPGYRSCRRTLGPPCLALYLPRGCGGRSPLTMVRQYRAERRRQSALPLYRAVLVASRHMRDEYRRHGVPDDRLTLAPLFPPDVSPDPAPPAPRPRSDRVLFVGRITHLKGLPHLAEAVARAGAELGRRLTLVVAGDGPERAAAEATVGRLGLPAEFLGWVGADRRQTELRAADVLGVPSVWPEPFGLVGLEAGCVGLPAVGYATGGIPDWLRPGESGESAPGDRPDPRELAAALVRALATDDHWTRLRAGAWGVACGFTPDAHLRALVATLRAAAGLPLPAA